MKNSFRVWRLVTLFLFTGVLLVACATEVAYYNNLGGMVSSGNYVQAAALIEKSKDDIYGKKDALLYYLDYGMLLQVSGQYAESNAAFESAKRLFFKLFTKSITTEAASFLVSDNVKPYCGEDFEQAQVNIFCALNYIMLGNASDALVEARQVDDYLKKLQTDYGFKDVYKEDAFARYLMGLIYEDQGQINDAYISFKQALDAYKDYKRDYGLATPQELIGDALRTATKLGFTDAVHDIKTEWPKASYYEPARGSGEIIVLDYNGFSAEKIETIIELAFGKAWAFVAVAEPRGEDSVKAEQATSMIASIAADDVVKIAFPKYEKIPSKISGFDFSTADLSGRNASGEVVQDISAIAIKNLDDRIARIRIKAIARAAIKFVLAHQISDQVAGNSGQLWGWVAKKAANVAATATEHADKRSWRSLPDKILMARLPVAEGTYTIHVKFYDPNGSVVQEKTLDNVVVKSGRKTFRIVRSAA